MLPPRYPDSRPGSQHPALFFWSVHFFSSCMCVCRERKNFVLLNIYCVLDWVNHMRDTGVADRERKTLAPEGKFPARGRLQLHQPEGVC